MNRTIRLFVLPVFLTMLIVFQAVPASQASYTNDADLEGFVDTWMQREMAAKNIPNAAVSIVRGGEVVLARGYGYASLEGEVPVRADETLFRVGSVSKLLTWTAVMQLVEQGQLALDTDVNTYLDFALPSQVITARGEAAPGPVTLRLLMTHRAGFEAYPDQIFRLSPEQLLPLEVYVREHMPQRIYSPGEVMAYSNYSAALAGYIVERVSGQPFAEYVQQNILAPLEMNHSTFRQPLPADLAPNMARAYRYVEGGFREAPFEYMQEPEGGMSATATDMARFMLAQLQGGTLNDARILQEDTLRLMHSQQFTYHQQLGGITLGWMEGAYNGQRTLFHGGSTMIFDSGLYLLPEQNTGVFISYSGGNHLFHAGFFQAFLDRFYPATNIPVPHTGLSNLERSRAFAGEYQQNTRSFTTGERSTSLMLGVVQVAVDNTGDLLVTLNGETNRFVESEPGVYRNLTEGRSQDYFGPFRTLMFTNGPFGQRMLAAGGPMTYTQAPWYATSAFTVLALVVPMLLLFASLLFWAARGLMRRVRRRSAVPARLTTLSRLAVMAFALLLLIFVVSVVMTGAGDPVLLLPPTAYGVPPTWAGLQNLIPALLIATGATIAVMCGLAWWKKLWGVPSRIHYTLLTAAGLLVLWVFAYWNVL